METEIRKWVTQGLPKKYQSGRFAELIVGIGYYFEFPITSKQTKFKRKQKYINLNINSPEEFQN